MNAYPIVLVCGKAGSGKDTAAAFIAEGFPNSQVLALADPLKRIAHRLFDFKPGVLWGPSEERNKPVHMSNDDIDKICRHLLTPTTNTIIQNEVRGVLDKDQWDGARSSFHAWAEEVIRKAEKEGELTPRYVLQTMGTEWARHHLGNDIWTRVAVDISQKLLSGDHSYNAMTGLWHDEGKFSNLVILSDGRFRNEILGVRKLGGLAIKIERETAAVGVAGHRSEVELDGIPPHFYSAIIQNNDSKGTLQDLVIDAVTRALAPERLPHPSATY